MADLANDHFPLKIFFGSIMENNPRQPQCLCCLLAERGGHVMAGKFSKRKFVKSGLLPKCKSFTLFHKRTVWSTGTGSVIRIPAELSDVSNSWSKNNEY